MLRLGVRRFILAVILAEKRLRRYYGLKETFGPDLAYGCRIAGACTMTVMRRGWEWGRRGRWTHKSIESVCMDSAGFPVSPLPSSPLLTP